MKIQKGQVAEKAAELEFKRLGWHMYRSQPAVRIVGVEKGRHYGTILKVRMEGKGGIADFTGYRLIDNIPVFTACEVKESSEYTMPASRLDKEQRAYMDALPDGSRFVGIFWPNGKFMIYNYIPKGSYKHAKK